MFSKGPSVAQFEKLSNVVNAQTDMLNALGENVKSLGNFARIASDNAMLARTEIHLLKILVAGLVAEIAAKCQEPYREIDGMLQRVRFSAKEVMTGTEISDQRIQAACDLICGHAQEYLRRGDRK